MLHVLVPIHAHNSSRCVQCLCVYVYVCVCLLVSQYSLSLCAFWKRLSGKDLSSQSERP